MNCARTHFVLRSDHGRQVAREVARVHRSRKNVQAAVVDLLAILASPDVFYHVSMPH
jgi:hypothetical protein